MLPGKLGLPEILLILFIALLIFGPSKLADLGKGIGKEVVALFHSMVVQHSPYQRHW